MAQLIINGGKSLHGTVKIGGAKNAVLPLMAATVLADDIFVLNNVPKISDVDVLGEILKDLGSIVTWTGDNQLTINNTNLHYAELDFEKLRKIRSSLMVVGPMLARFGKARFVEPGGCNLGTRSIDTHLHAFESLGAQVEFDGERYEITANQLTGTDFILDEMSVTGTANAVMAAVLAEGTTTIRLVAAEPENTNLIEGLISMGAQISGLGTHTLIIQGVTTLHGATLTVVTDRIEAGTYVAIALATQGDVVIDGYLSQHQVAVTLLLSQMSANFEILSPTKIHILPSPNLKPFQLHTMVYPGFPTDIQAPFGVLATCCHGVSEIFETLYDARLNYLDEINKMGGRTQLFDIHRAQVAGPTQLSGKTITCPDIRAGAGLLIAGLIADGTTVLDQIEKIDRGYTAIETKLSALGADIQRV